MRTSNSQFLTVAFLALLVSGCGREGADDGADEEEAAAIPVETVRPQRGDIDASYTGTAPIEAFADAVVIARVGGEILEILAEEGDAVTRDQVLARIDGERLRLEMEQAEANLRKLQRDYQRNMDLKDKGLISDGDFDKILFEMEALEARFNLARLEYDYTEIRAPIDGVVSERFVKIGNTIDVNEQVFQVTSLEPLISYLHVPEREYRRIGANQPAVIEVDALAGQQFEATVARVSPVVDPATGTFKLTIEVRDPSGRLKPGMFGRIGIVYDTHAAALQIPRGAVIEEGGVSSVFVVDGENVERRTIETGFEQGGRIEVVDGLADGDEIVVVGHSNLKDGSRVTVISSSGASVLTAGNSPTSAERS